MIAGYPIVETALANALTAGALGLAVALVTRRRLCPPAVAHVLWTLVLVRLLVPVAWEIEILPRPAFAATEARVEVATASTPGPASLHGVPLDPVGAGPSWTLVDGLRVAWLAGAALLAGVSLLRARRFRALIDEGSPPPASVARLVVEVAGRLGLRQPPRIRIVAARISPLVYRGLRRSWLVLPDALLQRLDAAECRTLVAHELAHLRRRDPWIRHVELAACTLFWWYPVVWWARGRLRRAEEQCCDAAVLRTLPGHARDYARCLLDTAEFLAGRPSGLPVGASGAGNLQDMEARLKMILSRRTPPKTSRALKLVLTPAALALLVLVPTWADRAHDDDPAGVDPPSAEGDASAERLWQLETEARELERALQDVRLQLAELRREQGVAPDQPAAEAWLREAERRRAEEIERRDDEAVRRDRAIAETERRHAEQIADRQLRAERRRVERGLARAERMAAEQEEIEQLARELDRERALELERLAAERLQAAESLRRQRRIEARRHAEQLQLEREVELDGLQREVERLRSEGQGRRAREVQQRLDELRRLLDADPGGAI